MINTHEDNADSIPSNGVLNTLTDWAGGSHKSLECVPSGVVADSNTDSQGKSSHVCMPGDIRWDIVSVVKSEENRHRLSLAMLDPPL